jgi:subtilase family serine protease
MTKAVNPASFVALHALFLPVLIASIPVLAVAQGPSVISTAPEDSVRTTIKRSTHPLARAEYDVGAVDSGSPLERLVLVLGPGEQNEAMLTAFLDSQQDKSSSHYHHWLSPEEFGETFGPSSDDVQ